MRWRLQNQLLVPIGTVLVGLVAVTAWTAYDSAQRARRQTEANMRDVARTLSEAPPFPLSPHVLGHMKRLSGAEFLLVTEDGRHVSTLSEPLSELPPAEAVHDDWHQVHLGPRVRAGEENFLCSGIRLRPPRQADTLYILYPESLWRDKLLEAIRPSLWLGVLALGAVALAAAVGQRLTRRIQELEWRTRQIAQGDFSPMPLPRRNDELRDLGRSVNDMAQRLAQLQETVQRTERLRLLGQVGGGLAHQLRNAVTGARLAVQLYVREHDQWQATDGPEPDPAALDVALRQLTLLETNLKRFLDLGRTDRPVRQPCALEALLGEAVALLQPQCRHAGIELCWRPPGLSAILDGDPGQLQQLFVNVLGNAVEAAGPGGTVEASLNVAPGGGWVVEVCDSGPGPTPQVAERLFEPFVTGKSEGVGLGLAVARQVAETHGGGIGWQRRDQRTCFRIELGTKAS